MNCSALKRAINALYDKGATGIFLSSVSSMYNKKGRRESPALNSGGQGKSLLLTCLGDLQPDAEADTAHVLAGEVGYVNILIA